MQIRYLSSEETVIETSLSISQPTVPWNKGRLIGQKLPLKLKDIWAIRIWLQLAQHIRDLVLLTLPSTVSCVAVT
jgi:hypothetical protein